MIFLLLLITPGLVSGRVRNKTSCQEWKNSDIKLGSGLYNLTDSDGENFTVYCYINEQFQAYAVIQRRIYGSVSFNKNWEEYKNGFGDLSRDFWAGNEIIHKLTSLGSTQLRVELRLSSSPAKRKVAEYKFFSVGNETSNYVLRAFRYTGNAGDGLTWHSGMQFTTPDQDNDFWRYGNCGSIFDGGWWYINCGTSSLNSMQPHPLPTHKLFLYWVDRRDTVVESEMMVRETEWTVADIP